jgi:ABC-type multidrug transport system ATPase subunit/ABC-type multidrug transport system permease subunit
MKRMTLGEMGFGLKAVEIVDEISSGMDPVAKLAIVESLKSVAIHFNRTVVVSLNRPTPEEFELFDDVMVLNDGHVIYHGPRTDALPYFHKMGLDCPLRKDVPEFLLEMGTPRQRAYKNATTDLMPMTPAEWATCFQQSELHQATLAFLNTPHAHREGMYIPTSQEMQPFRQTFWQDLALLLRRHWLLTRRNKAFVVGRTFMVLLMGALYGTTFWQLPDTSPSLVMGLLFSGSMFVALGPAAQIGEFMMNRAVFYKQRGANFYRTSSYVLASCLTLMPFALSEAILYGSILYWMGGFVPLADVFVKFLFTLFLCQTTLTAFFFLLSSASPHAGAAGGLSAIFIMVFILLSGFLITKSNIPDYFIWLYWINPVAWCIKALAVNQYTAPQFRVCVYKGVDYCKAFKRTMAQYSLSAFDFEDNTDWVYRSWLFFAGASVVCMILAFLLLEFKRFETPEDTMAIQVDLKSLKKRAKRERLETEGEGKGSLFQMDGEAMDSYVLHAQTPSEDGRSTAQRGSRSRDQGEQELTLTIPRDGCSGFVPVTIAFQDLWVSMPVPGGDTLAETDLVQDVSGFALPGTMTAFLGERGAGKTTLLDVISGRKSTGRVRGEIFLNGYPATDLALQRCAGYCDHLDIHSDSATFREAMQFAATLRQDASISQIEKFVHVEECIDLLELRPLADRIVRGATKEQLKRLTIGVEMAASPSVLFVDEPVGGLDGRSAMVIMEGLRKVADTGRTVICSMNRPSTDVFNLFDSALVLQRGGQMAFFGQLGDEAQSFIDYFEKVPGIAPLQPSHNPATWVLEALETQYNRPRHGRHQASEDEKPVALAPTVDFVAYFDKSDQCRLLEEDLDQDGITRPSPFLPEIKYERKRAAAIGTQVAQLMKRSLRLHWRTPTYDLARLLFSVILAAFFGVMYHGTNFETFRGANAGVGLIFLSSLFIGLVSFNSAVPVAAAERACFYRERASQTYNALYYFITSTIAEIPFVFLSGLIFSGILFPLVGFEGNSNFAFYWFVISLHLLVQVYMAQFLVYTLPSAKAAQAIGSLLSSIFLLFTGYNPPTSKIPTAYKWIHYIAPPTYTISSLSARLFSTCSAPGGPEPGCKVLQGAPAKFAGVPLKGFMEGYFIYKESNIWRDVGMLYMFIVVFRVLALVALRYVNHHKK